MRICFKKVLLFLAIAQALQSLYARVDSLSRDFGSGDVNPVE
jgi:hypothetical protein